MTKGKSVKEIKEKDYNLLKELYGREKADKIFKDDIDFKDDSQYPVREVMRALLIASLKRCAKERPLVFVLLLILAILVMGFYYYKLTYYW
jgi:t-SNARE complex subunit (syntaxin)